MTYPEGRIDVQNVDVNVENGTQTPLACALPERRNPELAQILEEAGAFERATPCSRAMKLLFMLGYMFFGAH